MKTESFFAEPASWVAVAFVIFFVLFGYKLWGVIASILDKRTEAVRAQLAEAQRLRQEAEAMREDAARQREAAIAEATRVLESARLEAARLANAASVESAGVRGNAARRWRWSGLPPPRRPRWIPCGSRRRKSPGPRRRR